MGFSSVHWMLRITILCSLILCGQCTAKCKLTVRCLKKIHLKKFPSRSVGRNLYTVTETIYNGWNQYKCSVEKKEDGLHFTSIGAWPWSGETIGPLEKASNVDVGKHRKGFIAKWENKMYNFEVDVDQNEVVPKDLHYFMFRDPAYRKKLADESASYFHWKQKDYKDALKNHFKFGNFNFSNGHKVFCYDGDNKNKPYWIVGRFENDDQKMFIVTPTDPSKWPHSLGAKKEVDVRTVSHFHVEERRCAVCTGGDSSDGDAAWVMVAACGHIMHRCCFNELAQNDEKMTRYEVVSDDIASHGAYIRANKKICPECRCQRTTGNPQDIRSGWWAPFDTVRHAGCGITGRAAWARYGCCRKKRET